MGVPKRLTVRSLSFWDFPQIPGTTLTGTWEADSTDAWTASN